MNVTSRCCSRECGISATEPLHRVRILGIDPGLQRTGFGVVDRLGARLSYVASGVIRVPPSEPLPARLAAIFSQVCEVVAQYRPDRAAIEKVFVNVNPNTTLLLGQARGAAITALASSGLVVAEFTPGQIKQAVTGSGRANKEQVQLMVMRLLGLSGMPSSDAADALACATCHAHGAALLGALSKQAVATAPSGHGYKLRRGRLLGS
jgi:crossover junction endodeoxyribonuclease RuvC